MYVSAIVLAAGKGLRFRSRIPKPLAKIKSVPVIVYSLKLFNKHPLIKDIILVVNSQNKRLISREVARYKINKVCCIVQGGSRRQDSVANGLGEINKKSDLVLIHDSARPLIEKDTVTKAIKEASHAGAAVVGVAVKPTIKLVSADRTVKMTLDRRRLWEAQTPQVFKKKLIEKAFKKFGNLNVTDDAMLVEKLGGKVKMVQGSYTNIKITTPEDLVIAEAIIRKR